MKSKRSILRRFKVTATGKIMHLRSFKRHLKSNKSARARRQKEIALTGSNYKKVKKMLHF
ncbi:50S ribosomal protein L35 [Candidatus Microgenomates bacterium]|nr:50S ribosomal protein L35 [Candidatus Microgenomates bacterium]